ncbi:hypothetical protein [Eisenbergiella sp.]
MEKYLSEKEIDLTATLDAKTAYSNANFVAIAVLANVCTKFSVAEKWVRFTYPKGVSNILKNMKFSVDM